MIFLSRPLIAVTALGLALALGSALTRVRAQTQPQTHTPQAKNQTQVQTTSSPASPLLDADEARAVVGAAAEKTRRVRIGDDIAGWKVTQIEERQLVLSLDDRSATFTLFSSQHAGPSEGQPLSAPVSREKE